MLLKEICSFSKGLQVKRDLTSTDYDIPYLHYGDLYKKYNVNLKLNEEYNKIIKVNCDCYNIRYQIDNNNIVMNLTSENYDDLGKCVIIKNPKNTPFIAGMETHLIKIHSQLIIPEYLNYYFESSSFLQTIHQFITGMKVFRVKPDDILNIDITLPNLRYQQHIVDIIGSIDDKIENNQKLINKLDKILLLKFKKNYLKASKSNLTINLNSIVTLKTGKKDANASIKNGKYPFFTCSEKESSINVYSFDQEAILIAGNGNMSVKYYNGKFDAYQRTYVISSDKYFYYLYLYYKSFINDISIGAKGSVIKFLTKSLLLDIDLPILNDNLMNAFEQNVKIVLNYVLMLEKENSKLIYLKQLYLKKFFR